MKSIKYLIIACLCCINISTGFAQTSLTINVTSITNTCPIDYDGSISVICTNGNGNITWSISPDIGLHFGDGDFQDFRRLYPSKYTITAKDEKGNTGSKEVEVKSIDVTVKSTTNVSCHGGSNGTVTFEAANAPSLDFFTIVNKATRDFKFSKNGVFSGLQAGTYSIECDHYSEIIITEPDDIVKPVISSVVNVSCNGGNDGQFKASGTGVKTFTLSPNIGTQSPVGTFNNLTAGTYQLTATDANGNCSLINQAITQPIAVTFTPPSVTNVKCKGGSDGSIIANAKGGTGVFTYNISPNVGTQSPTGTFNNLTAGTYTITATDANNCTGTTTVEVKEPATTLTINPVNIGDAKGETCVGKNDGSIVLSASNVTGTVKFEISPNVGTQSPAGTFTGLPGGNYVFTATDESGCPATMPYALSKPLSIDFSGNVTNVLCNGASTGEIKIDIFQAPWEYIWSNGATTQDIVNIKAGTYSVTVYNLKRCSTQSFTVTEPTAMSLSNTQSNILCNGSSTGAIDLTVSGATPDYTYQWSNGATTQDLSNIKAGTYTVTVTDANGCTATLTVTITELSALSISSAKTNILCNGASTGAIDLTISGATPGYKYKWSNGATTQDLTNIKAGDYTVTVTDINGCFSTLKTTLTQNSEIKINAGSCKYVFYGYGSNCTSLTATASGGGGTYTYKWSPGSLSGATVNVCPIKTTEYEVTVTDQYGCKEDEEVTVNVIDVRCGSKKDKITICHSGTTLCVDKRGVADHLAHGDKLGTCGTTACGLTLRSVESNITDHQNVLSLQYYPNPIDDRLNIQLEQVTEGVVRFELYDITGKMVKKEIRDLINGYNEVSLEVTSIPSGLYILQVKDSNNQGATLKLTKL